MIHLDTNAVLHLWRGGPESLPPPARSLLGHPWRWSPMVRLELAYLHEIGRTSRAAPEVLSTLTTQADAAETHASWATVVTRATELAWTRDPFDRLIAATALVDDAVLVTSDRTIRRHVGSAVWDEPDRALRRAPVPSAGRAGPGRTP